jgi:hypothetical protein
VQLKTKRISRPSDSRSAVVNNGSHANAATIQTMTRGSGSSKPKGCSFESYAMSQIYPLRVLSAFWLTAARPVPSKWPILGECASLPTCELPFLL